MLCYIMYVFQLETKREPVMLLILNLKRNMGNEMTPYIIMIWIIGSTCVICQSFIVGRLVWLACRGELIDREK